MTKDKQNTLLILSFLLVVWYGYTVTIGQAGQLSARFQDLFSTDPLDILPSAVMVLPLLLAAFGVLYGIALAFLNNRKGEPIQKSILSTLLCTGVLLASFYPPFWQPIASVPQPIVPRNGIKKDYWPNGQLKSEEPVVNGRFHGTARYFWANGKPYSAFRWKNGNYDGSRTLFRDDGSVEQQASAKDGARHGVDQWFNPDGTLQLLEIYDNGVLLFSRQFGQPAREIVPGVYMKAYFSDLPPYGKLFGIINAPIPFQKELADAARTASVSAEGCSTVSLEGEEANFKQFYGDFYKDLRSNICQEGDLSTLRSLFTKAAPFLDPKKLAFYKDDLDSDGMPDLLLGLVSRDKQGDPYFGFYYINFKQDPIQMHFKGPYLVGRWHAVGRFGSDPQGKVVFVRYQSCTECEPGVYLDAVDFRTTEMGMPFFFDYSGGKGRFKLGIEYELPGRGHSIDAEVETRIPRTQTKDGPWLLQRFALLGEDEKAGDLKPTGEFEWWAFSCDGMKCGAKMALGELPAEFAEMWTNGKIL